MNLREIRDEFIRRSGRYDLITDDGQDNGANFFIQSGSRFLDRRSSLNNTRKGLAVLSCSPDGLLHVQDCWLVHNVACMLHGHWVPLMKAHSDKGFRTILTHRGHPSFYVEKTSRYVPDIQEFPACATNVPASAFDFQNMACHHIMLEVFPHPSYDCTIRVEGCFYSGHLGFDEDRNIWSDRFPDTLIKAALYQLEIFYRNTEGASDWLNSIQLDLTDAEQLEVLAEIDGKDEMGL